MLPPKPIGQRKVDLEDVGQNISKAQHGQSTRMVPIHDKEKDKIIMVRSDDPRAKGSERLVSKEHVF